MVGTFAVGTAPLAGTPDTVSVTPSTDWTPADLGNRLAAWFDAKSFYTLRYVGNGNANDGGQVVEWASRANNLIATRVGTGYPYIGPASSARPGLYFAGDISLEFPAGLLPTGAAEGGTFAFAEKTNDDSGLAVATIGAKSGDDSPNGTFRVLGSAGGEAIGGYRNGTGYDVYAGGATFLNTPRILTDVERPNLGWTRIDGGVAAAQGGRTINTYVKSTAVIGGFFSSRLVGNIYELIFVTGALTDDEIYRVEGYLAWRWNKQADLPAGHAYKAAAPQRASAASTGTATGSAIATGQGSATNRGVGSATGSATATGSGLATARATGTAAGTSSATAVSAVVIATTGTAAGSSTATGAGRSIMTGTGSATGSATATAAGMSRATSTGTAAGTSNAQGYASGDAPIVTTGTAAGVATASGAGASRAVTAGTAAGSSTAVASSTVIVSTTGAAASTSTAIAAGNALVQTTGSAASTSAAIGAGAAVVRSTGTAAGTSSANGVAPAPPQYPAPPSRSVTFADSQPRTVGLADQNGRKAALADAARRAVSLAA